MKRWALYLLLLLVGTYVAYRVIRFSAFVVGASSPNASTIGIVGAVLYITLFVSNAKRFVRAKMERIARDFPERIHVVAIAHGQLIVQTPDRKQTAMPLSELTEIAAATVNVTAAGASVWIEARGSAAEAPVRFPIEAAGADQLLSFFKTLPGFKQEVIDNAWAEKQEGKFLCWRKRDA